MPTSYRSVILALGLILASTNHANAESRDENSGAQQSIDKSLQNISSRYDEQSERAKRADEEEDPCGEGKYSSSADLCAQWKAADAAAISAWWAWAAGISGIISTVGVVAALGIGLHSNWIARDAAKRQLRAYIGIDSVGILPFEPLGGDPANRRIKVVIKNFGQTPATLKNITLANAMMGDPDKAPSGSPKEALYDTIVNPGHSATVAAEMYITPAQDEALRLSTAFLVTYGEVIFDDIYGEREPMAYSYITSGTAYVNHQMREHRPKEV